MWWARRMRRSVLVYLVCLALVPMVGYAAITVSIVKTSRDQVVTARRVETALTELRTLDTLRMALLQEGSAAVGASIAVLLKIPLAQLSQLVRMRIVSIPQTRARSDALLTVLARAPETAGTAADIRRRVDMLRAEGTTAGPSDSATAVMERQIAHIQQVAQVLDSVAAAEIALGTDISSGRFGGLDGALPAQATQLSLVTLLVTNAGRRCAALFIAYGTGVPGSSAALAGARRADDAFSAFVDTLTPRLTGALAARWRALSSSPAARTLDDYAARLATARPWTAPTLDVAGAASVGTALADVAAQSVELLAQAVDDGVAAARASRGAATAHQRDVALTAGGLLGVTLLLLGTLGGTLRGRLNQLAVAAQRLSSGELRTVDIAGPREVELAGRGLNDAVLSLRRVLAGAERLAAGDLTAPELSSPLEGRLGVAVYASFQRVLAAIQERERLQLELAHAASHDGLTGLPNRSAAERFLAVAVEAAAGGRGPSAVLFIDLDHFKALNDTYGHAAGDHVLQVAGVRMAAQIRKDDTVCRLGGDEFIVVMHGSQADAAAIGARIVTALAEPILWGEHRLSIGASVGIAVCEDGVTSPDELLTRADHAVYRAKADGRGRVRD